MRMRVLREKLRVEIENETRVFLESLNFEIEMRVSQKSAGRYTQTLALAAALALATSTPLTEGGFKTQC